MASPEENLYIDARYRVQTAVLRFFFGLFAKAMPGQYWDRNFNRSSVRELVPGRLREECRHAINGCNHWDKLGRSIQITQEDVEVLMRDLDSQTNVRVAIDEALVVAIAPGELRGRIRHFLDPESVQITILPESADA